MLVFGVFFFPVPVFLEPFIFHSCNPFASCFDSWLYWLREREEWETALAIGFDNIGVDGGAVMVRHP